MVMTPSGGGLRLAYYPSVHPEAGAADGLCNAFFEAEIIINSEVLA